MEDPAAYFFHAKNCFYLENTNFLKKIKGDLQEISFSDHFKYFQSYWNLCRRRGIINPVEFFIYTKTIFYWSKTSGKKINGAKDNLLGFVVTLKVGIAF